MAYDPCAPFPDPGAAASAPTRHHLVHHVIGRIRHRVHHVGGQAAHPHVVLADACSKPVGALPALPGSRLPTLAVLPKGAALGKALGAASVLALAGAVGAGVATLPRTTTPTHTSAPVTASPQPGGSGTPVIVSPGSSTPGAPGPVSVPEPPSAVVLAVALVALGARRLWVRPSAA